MKKIITHAETISPPQKCITDKNLKHFVETYKDWSYDEDYMWNSKLNLRFMRCSSNKCTNCEPIEIPEDLLTEL